jgi:hypothetical protein
MKPKTCAREIMLTAPVRSLRVVADERYDLHMATFAENILIDQHLNLLFKSFFLPELTPTKNLVASIQYLTEDEGNSSSSEYAELDMMKNTRDVMSGIRTDPILLAQ